MNDRFVARPSIIRQLGYIVLMAGCGLLFLWAAGGLGGAPLRPGREWLGWLCAVLFGGGSLVLIRRLFDRRDQIVIDRRGVLWRGWSDTVIPWSAIAGTEPRPVRLLPFLCLHLHDPAHYPSSRWFGRMMAGWSRRNGFGDVSITTQATDRSFGELLDAVDRFCPLPPADG